MLRYRSRRRDLAGWSLAGLTLARPAPAAELPRVRVGALPFGTLAWELDVIRTHGLDRQEGFVVEQLSFAGNEGVDVALLGGAVDLAIQDVVFTARQRHAGRDLTLMPFSSQTGALIVHPHAGIDTLSALKGQRIGVAGGVTDKSWILLQAVGGPNSSLDFLRDVAPVFGAAPLLFEKFRQGEFPALLTYWPHAARLEELGYQRLIGVGELQAMLGVPADTVQLGYVARQSWAEASGLGLAFFRAAQAAKALLARDDREWERLMPLTRAESPPVQERWRDLYRQGIVRHWGEAERQQVARLYGILAAIGGTALVGEATRLPEGTLWPQVAF